MLGEPSWEPYISEWQESFLSLLSDLNLFLQLPSRFASFSPTSTESPVQSPRIRQTRSIPHRIYVEKAGCVVGRRSIFCLYGLAVLICKIRALNLDCVITQILSKSIFLVYSLSTILNIILSTPVFKTANKFFLSALNVILWEMRVLFFTHLLSCCT